MRRVGKRREWPSTIFATHDPLLMSAIIPAPCHRRSSPGLTAMGLPRHANNRGDDRKSVIRRISGRTGGSSFHSQSGHPSQRTTLAIGPYSAGVTGATAQAAPFSTRLRRLANLRTRDPGRARSSRRRRRSRLNLREARSCAELPLVSTENAASARLLSHWRRSARRYPVDVLHQRAHRVTAGSGRA
jgi:hypothetical protein